ncbi:MAG: AAA domain-containing protein [Bacteroidota bacterium]
MDLHIAELFLEAKEQILKSRDYSTKHKIKALFNLLTGILEEVTQSEKIVFTTLFSRIAFMSNRYKLDPKLMYYLHTFRRDNERMKTGSKPDLYLKLGSFVIEELINVLWNDKTEISSLAVEAQSFFGQRKKEVDKFRPVIEVIIDSINIQKFEVYFYKEEDASVLYTALFDQQDRNELFNENIELLTRSFSLPVHANLIDVEILNDGTHIPGAIVLDPDYLLDVTAVANCFKDYGANSMLRILSRFKPLENSIPLMVGNIANMFLDEIISNPDVKFQDLLPKIFKLDPLAVSNFNDNEIRELVSNAKNHYLNLKKAVATELPSQGIRRDKVFLEPSFYSRDYGVQGRLDLFHIVKEAGQFDIVELKSGRPFMANVYGLSASHYSQTLLYDLMIKSTFGHRYKPNNYILYSKLNDKSLKYAPPVKSQQYEAMRIRNELIAIEYKMATSPKDAAQLFRFLTTKNFEKVKGFELKDLERFQRFYGALNHYEFDYFNSFSSFIAREHRMAKTGEHGMIKSNGLAALWLENMEEKEDRFGVLKALTIAENRSQNDIPTILLHRSAETSELANFRVGDIAVLYPSDEDSRAILKNQIFKCTILKIDQNEVEVKLRSKQYNDVLFKSIDYWNVEADSLDSGFNTLYRSLFEFLNAKKDKRELWMGMRPPKLLKPNSYVPVNGLTKEQNELLNQMANTKDYYLLWGPPGTGKTSIMLKSLTQRLFDSTDENILLLAYTNRAVDEICAAIESIGEGFENNYVRLGSSTSCMEQFKPRLINNLISSSTNRQEIRRLIQSKRIFISTVSSIVSKKELFKLKRFDRVIVDEASQILEPMLLGLLSRIEKAVLIGDHKQLPAVVTQTENLSKIKSENLLELGISDMSMSLFERLYHRCLKMQWDHAYGLLSYQGRMHQALMDFPNSHFYQNKLKVLPNLTRLVEGRGFRNSLNESQVLVENRFIYVPTEVDMAFNWKTNKFETIRLIEIIRSLEQLYLENERAITKNTIGIITPYRAQIATIRKSMEEEVPHLLEYITIDTVERYQGGARDIILLSLCTNKLSQLKSLVSLSNEGIDRKLNVAMTRAREQLVILGNREILSSNETYDALMNSAYEWKVGAEISK